MPFKPAVITAKPTSTGTGVKATLAKRGNGKASLRLTFGASVLASLNWSNGDKLQVLIGTGSDHGMIRVRKNNSSGEAVVTVKQSALSRAPYATVSLGHQADFVDRAESGAWCKHEGVDEGWLEIVLPRWADATRPKSAGGETEQIIQRQAPKPVQGRAVTGSVMGDPAPGRKEMMAKIGQL